MTTLDQKITRLERGIRQASEKFAHLEALFHVIKERLQDDCTYEWVLADLGADTAARYSGEMTEIDCQSSAEQSSQQTVAA